MKEANPKVQSWIDTKGSLTFCNLIFLPLIFEVINMIWFYIKNSHPEIQRKLSTLHFLDTNPGVEWILYSARQTDFNLMLGYWQIPFNSLRFGKFLARDKPCWLGSISTRLPWNVLNISLDVNDPILCRPSEAKRLFRYCRLFPFFLLSKAFKSTKNTDPDIWSHQEIDVAFLRGKWAVYLYIYVLLCVTTQAKGTFLLLVIH